MATPLSDADALELINELRGAWTTDRRRSEEIVDKLRVALHGDVELGWAEVRRERLQREYLQLERREYEKRQAGADRDDTDWP